MTLFIVLALSACGTSLQKPSGLEESEDKKENVTEGTVKEESKPADWYLSKKEAEEEKKEKKVSDEHNLESTEDKALSSVDKKEETTIEPIVEKKTSSKKEPKNPESEKVETDNKTSDKVGKPVESKPNTKPVETKPTVTEKPKPKPKPVEKPVEKPKPTKPKEEPKPEPKKNTIVTSIVLSSSEIPLPPTEIEIKDGDTAFQTLVQITKANGIQMDYRGGQGATAYIRGIANVYEFDRGQGSGWMYRVNGIFPDRGAGVVPLLGGDRVEWLYTTNLGVDLGAELKPFRR